MGQLLDALLISRAHQRLAVGGGGKAGAQIVAVLRGFGIGIDQHRGFGHGAVARGGQAIEAATDAVQRRGDPPFQFHDLCHAPPFPVCSPRARDRGESPALRLAPIIERICQAGASLSSQGLGERA